MLTKEKTFELDASLPATRNFGLSRLSWDSAGIVGSVLCILHCLSMPLLLGIFSFSGLAFLGNEIVHQVLAIVLIAVAIFAFLPGYKRHRSIMIPAIAAIGIFLLLAAGFLPHHVMPHDMEWVVTMAGSFTLVGAHFGNYKLRKNCC